MKFEEFLKMLLCFERFKAVLERMQQGTEFYSPKMDNYDTVTYSVSNSRFVKRTYDSDLNLISTVDDARFELNNLCRDWHEWLNTGLMSFGACNKFMQNGILCKRDCWTDFAIYADDDGDYIKVLFEDKHSRVTVYSLNTTDLNATDWRIHRESDIEKGPQGATMPEYPKGANGGTS